MRLVRGEELWFQVAVALGLLIGLRRSEVIGSCEYAINWEMCQILISQTVTQQTIDGKNTLTVKPFTKNRKPKELTLVLGLNKLIDVLIEEHKKNAKAFGEKYDHTWDGYLI